jgi:hypothetical protein
MLHHAMLQADIEIASAIIADMAGCKVTKAWRVPR